jgi:hypothetical protein
MVKCPGVAIATDWFAMATPGLDVEVHSVPGADEICKFRLAIRRNHCWPVLVRQMKEKEEKRVGSQYYDPD